MNNIGKRLMPIYLIKFLEENYFDIIPENFGKRMVSRQFIAEIKALYDEFDGKPIDNYGRRMVPEYLIKAFSDIEYIEYTDDDVKYEKTVPTGALKYATLDMLGGMSYKCLNYFSCASFNEIGAEYNANTCYFKYKGSNQYYALPSAITLEAGTYTIQRSSNANQLYLYDSSNNVIFAINGTTSQTKTFESNVTITKYASWNGVWEGYLQIVKGSSALNYYQPYFDGIRDSAITSVVSKDSNNITLDTLTIPAEVQALTGYGWGINDTCYNYIDYEAKKFVQKVKKYVLNGNEAWQDRPNFNDCDRFVLDMNNELKSGGSGLCDEFIYNPYVNSTIGYICNNNGGQLIVNFSTKGTTTLEQFKTWLSNNNVVLIGELATSVETDISDYIKDNFIEVEPTGSVTFTNEYEQAVPSEVTYLIKE